MGNRTGINKNQICITFDLDWAVDEIIQPIVEILEKADIKATFFATHRSRLMEDLNTDLFEVGLHPKFDGVKGDFRSPIQELKALYPDAKGGRSHRLFQSSEILQFYREGGLVYENNTILPFQAGLQPAIRIKGLVSIPFYWADDLQFHFYDSFDLSSLKLETPGLKVLMFHPIHVFMNTSTPEHYESYRKYYQNPAELGQFINREAEGIGTLFRSLIYYILANGKDTYTVYEIYQKFISDGMCDV